MSLIQVKFADGAVREFEKGLSVKEILTAFNPRLAREAIAVKIDGKPVDLAHTLSEDCTLEALTPESEEGLDIFRHSTAHLMAHAVQELFPQAKLAIGPPIEDGFYYDFDMDRPFTPEDLERIEEKMKELARADLPIKRVELTKEEAVRIFTERKEPYKVEMIQGIEDSETISCYQQGSFFDLCRGPHVSSTGYLKAFKLLNAAGAYWRGDEKNRMLQRIYGTVFPTKKELDEYLKRLEEAKRRDHRKLGQELDLFSIHPEIGPGLVFWHPKGATVRRIIEDFWKEEHIRRGYQLVCTPHIAHSNLWRTSGHYNFYRENMYTLTIDEEEYVLKPMNCPGHIMIYKSHVRSYRDLPIRYSELGTVYRYERSGVLHGTLRVRGFTQDDAHIFCTPEQLPAEVEGVIDLAEFILKTFGFSEYQVELSVRDPNKVENYAGSNEEWEYAEEALIKALDKKGLPFKRREGEAVFYGPKIDVKLIDAIGRGWQCTTIQFDFNLPRRFDVTYVAPDGRRYHTYMVHRAIFGSLERFMGTLIEHYAGAFPTWLAPVQVRLLPISDRHLSYASKVKGVLDAQGFRTELDDRNEKIGYKIREAQVQQVPYMLVVGDKESAENTISIRHRRKGDLGSTELSSFIKLLSEELGSKS